MSRIQVEVINWNIYMRHNIYVHVTQIPEPVTDSYTHWGTVKIDGAVYQGYFMKGQFAKYGFLLL